MKKLVALNLFIIMTFILFTGCSNNEREVNSNEKKVESSYNPFDLNEQQGTTEAEFGFGPVNPIDELTYTGKPLEMEYFYDNVGDTDCKLGFMIFIDGVVQAYKIDGKSNEDTMHEFNVNKKSKIKFKVSFTPSVGRKGNQLGLYAATIFNPKYVPTIEATSFGNNLALSQVLPVKLKYLETVSSEAFKINDKYSTESITNEIKDEYLSVDKNKPGQYDSNNAPLFHLKYKGDYKTSKIELKKGSKLNLTLEGLCGPDDGNYRTTVFIDNKPVKTIDGKEHLEMQLKKTMLSKQKFDVNIDDFTGEHVLYTVSIPKGNDYSKITNPIVQSSQKLIVVGE